MKGKPHTEEQIAGFLKEAETAVPVKELCLKHGISEQSFQLWKSKYDGPEVSKLHRQKELEEKTAG